MAKIKKTLTFQFDHEEVRQAIKDVVAKQIAESDDQSMIPYLSGGISVKFNDIKNTYNISATVTVYPKEE